MATDIFGGTLIEESQPRFDQFGGTIIDDGAPATPPSSMRRVVDVGISALKGAIGVPESAVGLSDIVTGGYAGQVAEDIGFRPKEAKVILDEYLSPQQQAANKALADTKGFLASIGTAVRNPSTILHSAVESLPLMGGGGVVARGLIKSAGVLPWVAGAIGEGLASAGQNAEQVRQETPGGLLSGKQALSQVASGIGTGALAMAGAGLARKLHIADIDTMIAQGSLAAPAGASAKGFVRRLAEGAVSEGIFEELPQSLQDQMWQNYATGKPIMDRVPEAGAMGMLTGAVMGGPAAALGGFVETAPPPLTQREKILDDAAKSVLAKAEADAKLSEQLQKEKANDQQIEHPATDQEPAAAAPAAAAETVQADEAEVAPAPLVEQPISASAETAPKTVGGIPVSAQSDEQLQARKEDQNANANTRRAADAALQDREQNPEARSGIPLTESQVPDTAKALETGEGRVTPTTGTDLPEIANPDNAQVSAAPIAPNQLKIASQNESIRTGNDTLTPTPTEKQKIALERKTEQPDIAPTSKESLQVGPEVERFQGKYKKGMAERVAKAQQKRLSSVNPQLAWTVEKSTIPEFPDRFDVVGRKIVETSKSTAKPVESPVAAQPATPAQPTAKPKIASPAPASQAAEANWLESLPAQHKESVFTAMREIDAKAMQHDTNERALRAPQGSIPVGSAGFDEFIRAEGPNEFLRGLRKGLTPEQAETAAKAYAREAVAKHNAKRPDYTWQRADMTGDHAIEMARQKVDSALKPAQGAEVVKEPWQMTRDAYTRQQPERYRAAVGNAHKIDVIRALRDGKPVPANVLADYPDLAKQPEPAKAPARTVITPSEDAVIGKNAAGEQLYERPDGSVYRMHQGRPNFGGDLAPAKPAEAAPPEPKGPEQASAERAGLHVAKPEVFAKFAPWVGNRLKEAEAKGEKSILTLGTSRDYTIYEKGYRTSFDGDGSNKGQILGETSGNPVDIATRHGEDNIIAMTSAAKKEIDERRSELEAKHAEDAAREKALHDEVMRTSEARNRYFEAIAAVALPKGVKKTIKVKDRNGKPLELTGTDYDGLFIHKIDDKNEPYSVADTKTGLRIAQFIGVAQAKDFIRAVIHANLPRADVTKLSHDDLARWFEVAKTHTAGGEAPKYFTEQKPEPAPAETPPAAEPKPASEMTAADLLRAAAAKMDEAAKPARTDQIGSTAAPSQLDAFLADMTPQEAGSARAALSKTMTFRDNGQTTRGTIQAAIENSIASGDRVALTAAGPALVGKDMKGWNKRTIGEYGMQYANWLSSRETAPNRSETATTEIKSNVGTSQQEPPILSQKEGGIGDENTEDAGAELEYNRRNRIRTGIKWADIADKNETLRVSETTKQNVYPKPDYDALIAGDVQPLVAHIVKQVYDSIAAKPNTRSLPTDADLKTYIEGVNRVMTGVTAWANDKDAVGRWAQSQQRVAGAMLGRPTSITDLANQPKTLLDSVYPDGWKAHREEIGIIGSNKVLRALQPGYEDAKRAIKAVEQGWPAKQEAWQKQGYSVTPKTSIEFSFHDDKRTDGTPYSTLSYKVGKQLSGYETFSGATAEEAHAAAEAYRDSIGEWALTKKNGDIIGSYATEELAAEAARAETKREGKTQISDKGIAVESAERMGEARRMEGEDVSSDKLRDTFGFKGVNFGTWMKGDTNQAERQLHLNHAYDSFMDLADILGVPHKAMSLNGMLGVAVGAQGSGKYAAHFVPGLNEINLTRTSGAGSLAHEFGHALDHYFANQGGLAKSSEPFLTEHVGNVDADGYTKRAGVKEKAFGEGLRPEIAATFKSIVDAMNTKQENPLQVQVRLGVAKAKSLKQVNNWLASIKRDFMANKIDEQKFDALAERIRTLDLGDGVVAAGNVNLSPVVDELRSLYKEKTGRVYSLDQTKGLQHNVDHSVYLNSDRAAERTHVPQQVTTDYATNAAALDKGKSGKKYWSTNLEKFARAFDAFVSDTLAEKAAKNTYLSHADRQGETVPAGEERTAINKAFQTLVDTVETRETDKGTALFSNAQSTGITDTITPEMRQRGLALRDRITEMLGNRPDVIVKTFMATPESPIGSYSQTPFGSVITMALNAKDELSIADHEGFHVAEDLLLSDPEREVVGNALRTGRPLFNRAMQAARTYDKANGTAIANEIATIPAEARAYAFEFYRRGDMKADGVIGRIFAKLQQFLERIQNAVNGLGFTSAEDVFRALDEGRLAGREQNEEGSGVLEPQFARGRGGVKTTEPSLWNMDEDQWKAYKKTVAREDLGAAIKQREQQTEQAAQSMMSGQWEPLGNIIDRMGIEGGRVGGAMMRLQKTGAVERKEVPGSMFNEYRYRLNPVWSGRLTFPDVSRGNLEPPNQSNGQSSAAIPERAGVQTEKFDLTTKQPTVQYKGKKIDRDTQFSHAAVQGGAIAGSWVAPEAARLDSLIYTLQDKQIDTRRVLQAIRATSKQVGDVQDVYLQEELFHGRAAKETQLFVDDELKPLITEMAARGVTMQEFEEYLHARHAEEANAVIAGRNPAMPDGGSGITTKDAQDYLATLDPEKQRDFEALAKRVDAINDATRQLLVDYELESRDMIDTWKAAYKHYVPLHREDMGGGPGIGQGFSIRGPASKMRTGSARTVVDILGNIAMQREKTIVRGEKNVVSTALYGLAKANPNPDFWTLAKPGITTSISTETGAPVDVVDMSYQGRDNVVMSRALDKDGKIVQRGVEFNLHNERALRMALALKNLDTNQMGEILSASAKATRYFASVNTQYNPIFGVVNLTRDSQQAMFNLSTTPIAGKQADVAKHILSALKGVYLDLRSERNGQHPSSSWAQLFEEFQKEGGQTGYRDMFRTGKDRAEAIQRELERAGEGKIKHVGRAVFDWLSDYNSAMENAVRLAAYKVGKESGMTNQRAASMAKNLTVNFNRKGQIGMQAGALYAFFNASVQGSARLAETLAGPMGRKIIIGGITLGAVQALMLAAAGFDDDEPPQFVRERSLIIPIGDKKYLTIPMPLGLHFIPNIGRVGTEFALSGFKNPGKRVMDLGNVFADAFNPIGSAGLSLQTIAPTIIDPFAALAENRDWTGKPIYREDMSQLSPSPGHARAKDTASYFSKTVSKALNFASGGTTYKPGIFSPTPDAIDYLIGQATGGVGREAMKAEQSIASVFSGEELPTYKVPLVGRFYGNAEQQSSQGNAFYNNLKAINEHEAEIKGRRKAGEPLGDYIQENPEARLVHLANATERQVSALRKRKRELIAKDMGQDDIKAVDLQITARMKTFNDRVKQVSASAQ